mmetsp:Transcript_18589/g.27635  ORF Transcript_18589/g.27635 Transcript_18589/m.27635 type:complete len:80 (+) Transcript_18589:233-472(+)
MEERETTSQLHLLQSIRFKIRKMMTTILLFSTSLEYRLEDVLWSTSAVLWLPKPILKLPIHLEKEHFNDNDDHDDDGLP